jgi:DNA topoisomerase IA
MAKNLIVESPVKAKTIEKFLGSDYQVDQVMGILPTSLRKLQM